MGDVIPFKPPGDKPRGNTLCRRGFHKWEVVKERKFDVRQGRLVSVYRCRRCGEEKVKAR